MSLPVAISGAAKNLSASGAISTGPCQLIGFYVNSTGGGTLVIKDGGTSGTALNAAATPVAGWHWFPAQIGTSAYATISGTLDVTFFFASGN